MYRMIAMLLGATALIIFGGCDELQPKTLRERNKETFDKWANTHVSRLYEVCQDQYRGGQMKQVETKAIEALRLDPDHEGFLLLLGKVQIELGKYEAAEATLTQLATDSPKRFDVHYFTGIARERRGDLEGAYQSFQRAHELSGGLASEVTAAVTEALISMGKPAEAKQFLDANMPAPGTAEPRMFELAGRLAGMLGEHGQAIDYFERACMMDPENRRYPEMLGVAQFKAGLFKESAATFTRVVERAGDASNPRMLLMLGDSQLALGAAKDAVQSYGLACAAEPRRAVCWTSLAKGQLMANEPSEAAESARRALQVAPEDLDALQILAFALLRQNEVVEAARVLKQARKSHPRDTTITCLLGRTYAAVGRHEQAERFYSYALTLDPECVLARRLLQMAQRGRASGEISRSLLTP